MDKGDIDNKQIEFKVLSTTYKINSNYSYIKTTKKQHIRILNINYKDNIYGDIDGDNNNSIMSFIKKN